ncbi:hypothetical protein STEG23_037569, partial [Scotinomys teguina]
WLLRLCPWLKLQWSTPESSCPVRFHHSMPPISTLTLDLKCENILLDDQGFLKLADFGSASCVRLKNSLLSTFCGSVAYMAPEILMSKEYNEQEHSQSAIAPPATQSLEDTVHQKQRLQHLQRQDISKESVSGPGVQHLEACTRGTASTSLGLWHSMTDGHSLCPTFPNRNIPGHYLVN